MQILLIFLTIFCGYFLPAKVEARIKSLGTTVIRQELCLFIASAGVCRKRKHYKVYAYDYLKNRCHPFLYSGCGGNPNRFATKAECLNMCDSTKTTLAPVDSDEDYGNVKPVHSDFKPIDDGATLV